MYYSKLDQEKNACSKVLTELARLREVINKGRQVGNSQKWSQSLTEAVANEFKWQFKQGFTMLVVTRAGRQREWSPLPKFKRLEVGELN